MNPSWETGKFYHTHEILFWKRLFLNYWLISGYLTCKKKSYISKNLVYSVSHISIHPPDFSENQGNHQNLVPSLVYNKVWLIWIDLKQFFFFEKKIKMAESKKLSFSTTTKSWAIAAKILRIGPWVSRINCCEGHSFCSAYMVVRLSDVSSIYC